MQKQPTLQSIAAETGLSITSISLVLNNRPINIAPENRKLILETAKRLGYNNVRRRKSANRESNTSQNISVVIPDITNPFFTYMLRGISDVITPNGYNLMLSFTNDIAEREAQLIASLPQQNPAGLIITTTTHANYSEQNSSLFEALNMPVILVDRVFPSLNYSTMTYNHRKGAYLATHHLLSLGHRKIACVIGEGLATNTLAPDRMEGFRWAFSEYGLSLSDDNIFYGDYTEGGGYRVAQQIFARDFTAIFSGNDSMAFGIYRYAREHGIVIPDDISVVGFDDLTASDMVNPPLTTVRQDAYVLGREAANRLISEIDNPGIEHRAIYFEPTLKVRNSTKPLAETNVEKLELLRASNPLHFSDSIIH